jgi:hypothetical protein
MSRSGKRRVVPRFQTGFPLANQAPTDTQRGLPRHTVQVPDSPTYITRSADARRSRPVESEDAPVQQRNGLNPSDPDPNPNPARTCLRA